MDGARYDQLIGAFAYSAIVRMTLAMAKWSNFIHPFVRVVWYYAVGSEDDGFGPRHPTYPAWRDFGGLSWIRAEECARQVRASVGQDSVFGR